MDMQTGKISLRNPDADTDWETSKSMSTEKVAYYCSKKDECDGPREITKPIERHKEEDEKATTVAVSESQDIGRAP